MSGLQNWWMEQDLAFVYMGRYHWTGPGVGLTTIVRKACHSHLHPYMFTLPVMIPNHDQVKKASTLTLTILSVDFHIHFHIQIYKYVAVL